MTKPHLQKSENLKELFQIQPLKIVVPSMLKITTSSFLCPLPSELSEFLHLLGFGTTTYHIGPKYDPKLLRIYKLVLKPTYHMPIRRQNPTVVNTDFVWLMRKPISQKFYHVKEHFQIAALKIDIFSSKLDITTSTFCCT